MIELNRILCPVDLSVYSEHALIFAMKMAKWYDARLDVLHVMPSLPPSSGNELAATARDLTAKQLRSLVDRNRLPDVDAAIELVESGEAAPKIRQFAEAFDADLIVTGSHGRKGVQRVFLGSVVESLVHTTGRPMLIIPSHLDPRRAGGDIVFERILCAIDFAAASVGALAYALSLAEESDAALTLLHVIETPPELKRAPRTPGEDVASIRAEEEGTCRDRLAALIPPDALDYCTVDTVVREGRASQQILELAGEERADLIVLGVHGRNAFDLAFFGSNSKDVVREASCPILVVPDTHHVAAQLARRQQRVSV